MINEIRKRLNNGAMVELECIDLDGFKSSCKENKGFFSQLDVLSLQKLTVNKVGGFTISFEIDGGKTIYISEENYKYFRIKEIKEKEMSYSEKLINKDSKFQELLAAASYAVARGKLSSFIVNDMDCSDKIGNALYLGLNMTYHAIENEIKGINEMIDESSVVEQEVEGIKKVGFDDLIDVAVQAMKDDRLYFRFLSNDQISFSVDNTEEGRINILKDSCDDKDLQDAINFVNSLHTETFAIEKFSDTKRLKSGAKAVLGNGEEVIFSNRCGVDDALWFEYNDCHSTIIPFIALKGATVTQQKGN